MTQNSSPNQIVRTIVFLGAELVLRGFPSTSLPQMLDIPASRSVGTLRPKAPAPPLRVFGHLFGN